jgi:hypothetical protein
MKLLKISFFIAIISIFLNNCKPKEASTFNEPVTALDIKNHISVLANDSLTGRMPFTEGENKTINYIAGQFKQLGLEPGNKGSYFQNVPMVDVTSFPSNITVNGKTSFTFKPTDDFSASTQQELDSVQLKNSPLVFAGYGIVAPEYNWNDYKNLDVKGKTVIVLVNDPGFKSGNSKLFKGDTMTYYGRWTYKYEEAARQGAAGVLVIHQTEPASYPFTVVNGNGHAKLYLQQAATSICRVARLKAG